MLRQVGKSKAEILLELKEATEFVESCMKATSAWAEGLPITCESDSGKSYGEAAE